MSACYKNYFTNQKNMVCRSLNTNKCFAASIAEGDVSCYLKVSLSGLLTLPNAQLPYLVVYQLAG